MGLLINGVWHNQWYDTHATGGRFVRQEAQFRNWITPNGRPGPSGPRGYPAEAGRYHLYVSHACPWSHRTVLMRKLKGLRTLIGMSVVHPLMGEQGWSFAEDPESVPDTVNHCQYLYELYLLDNPTYSGRVTVPVLWDTQTQSIVSNESSDILRMFNSAFAPLGATDLDYCPPLLRAEIDSVNDWVYQRVNNGVYRAGFSTTQQAYEEAVTALFVTLDRLETMLATQRYLVGSQLTEADWRLFVTLVRFDAVYYSHFKCNLRRLVEYPHLWAYTRELYQVPGVAETVRMAHIKRHYYGSHSSINPTGIVPLGPVLDFTEPHRRDRIPAKKAP